MKYEKGRLLPIVLKKRSVEKTFLFAIRLFLTVHLRIKMGGTLSDGIGVKPRLS